MEIRKECHDDTLTIQLVGRLDTTTAPELEKELTGLLKDVHHLIFDFASLEYISSAGLRIMLTCLKTMAKTGDMKIIHTSSGVKDIFDMTGFSELMDIE